MHTHIYTYTHTYIYIYIYACACVYVYIYIYIERERKRYIPAEDREAGEAFDHLLRHLVVGHEEVRDAGT